MELVVIDPQHAALEEIALFAFCRVDPVACTGLKNLWEVFEQYVFPLLQTGDVHPDLRDNYVAFAALGVYLNPLNGRRRFLPQHSPHWLAFRRLFLAICDDEVPEELRTVRFQSMWASWQEDEREAFLKKHGHLEWAEVEEVDQNEGDFRRFLFAVEDCRIPESEREARLRRIWDAVPRAGRQEILKEFEIQGEFEGREETDVELSSIKRITETRLRNYRGLSLSGLKRHFIETGKIEIGKECGTLYEIGENLLWSYVPESLDLPVPGEVKSTVHLLKEIIEEEGIRFDMETDYREAARSVRGVLFDIAVEATLGKSPAPEMDAWEMEQLFSAHPRPSHRSDRDGGGMQQGAGGLVV